MKRILLALPAAAAFGLLAAGLMLFSSQARSTAESPEAGSWLMYQHDPTHNAVFAAADFRENWVTKLGGRINGGLAIADGTIYAVSFDKRLYALDERTGRIKWSSLPAADILMSTPVLAHGVVVVGSGHIGWLKPDDWHSQVWGDPKGDDELAYTTGGKPIWSLHTVGQDMPSPAISGDTVIFANGDLHMYALDLQTGKARWIAQLPGIPTMASATIADGMVFTSICHNAPYVCETRAMDVASGRTIWTNPWGGSDCSPTIGDGLVFVNANIDDTEHYHTGGYDVVAAMDEHTGKTVWTWRSAPGPYTFPSSNERQIAGTYDRGVYYQPIGQDSRVVAFSARSGHVRWNLRTWAGVKMSPVVKDDRVYFGDVDGILYNVDRRTGRVMHTSSFLKPFSVSPPIIVGDTMFLANDDMVLALDIAGI